MGPSHTRFTISMKTGFLRSLLSSRGAWASKEGTKNIIGSVKRLVILSSQVFLADSRSTPIVAHTQLKKSSGGMSPMSKVRMVLTGRSSLV
jgi:hypothetical protein